MHERGMTNEELEKALREEEAALTNQEQNEGTEETISPEVVEESNEAVTEAKIEELTEAIESKSESIEKDLAEVGGEEGIKNTLDNMSVDKKKELAEKINDLSKRISRQKEYAKDELIFAIPFSGIFDPVDSVFMEVLMSITGAKAMIGVPAAIQEFSRMLSLKKKRRALVKEQAKLG